MRILSDFDGVWTNQAVEAREVLRFLASDAARLAGVDPARAALDFAEYEREVLAAPAHFGWAPDGRISAYVDEDPFCVPNAITSWIGQGRDARSILYRDAIAAGGFATPTAFGDHCFQSATAAFRRLHPPALVPRAREILDELHELGARVVIVSNSPPEKILGWFRGIGVDAGESPEHRLGVRGSAGKQTLGPSDRSISVGGRAIHVDRPRYRRVIEEEAPDLVVGDVFSLDLALPHVMRGERDPRAPRQLVLCRHAHTPNWVLETRAGGAIDHVVEGIGGLASCLG